MRHWEAFEAWLEYQSTKDLVMLAVSSASRSIAAYYEFCDPEEYMRDLFSNSEYSGALALAERHLQGHDGHSVELLVAAVPVLGESIEFLERNIEEASGGADVVGQRRRALFACKSVRHAVIALVWPLGSDDELSQCLDIDEKVARAESGGRYHARMGIEFASMALTMGLMPFLVSIGASGVQ